MRLLSKISKFFLKLRKIKVTLIDIRNNTNKNLRFTKIDKIILDVAVTDLLV